MKFLSALVLLVLGFYFTACKQENQSSEFIINGSFTNFETNKVILEELGVRDLTPVDSSVIDNTGNFTLRHNPDDIGLYILRVGENNFVTLLIDKNENLTIKADASKMAYSYVVEGSEGSELLMNYYRHTAKNKLKVDSLARIFQISRNSPEFLRIREELDSNYRIIFNDQQEYVMNFISDNPSSLASLIVLNKRFGNGYLLSENDHFEYFHKLDSGLMAVYPDNKHSIDHHQRVANIIREKMERELADKNLQPGKAAPHISVNDSNEIAVPLSETLGKITLIYFWAAENAQSRQINPELKQAYEEHKEKGFEIYAISLDRNPLLWKAAVKLDGLKWIQLNDSKGFGSPLVKLYNLPENLPYFYLLDKEGLILLRGNKDSFDEIIGKIRMELVNK